MTSTETRFLRYRGKNRLFIEVGDGTAYVAMPNNDICIVEVQANHVAELLLKRCGCCGNEFTCFAMATEADLNRWRM